MALQYKWLLKSRSPICFAGLCFPQQVCFFPGFFFFLFSFFFVICKILPQFGTYKYPCPRVSLSGNYTSLFSCEISQSPPSCCPARPPPPQPPHVLPRNRGCPAAAAPPRRPGSQLPRAGLWGWGSPLLLLCWLRSRPHSLFSPCFPGVKVTALHLGGWYCYKGSTKGCIQITFMVHWPTNSHSS